jgi:cytidyltransferase-like protein
VIIQILGLPGSGKTTLAEALKERLNAIHLNADEVRATLNSDLGFSEKDRAENARRLGEMARLLSGQGHTVIVDFICPTKATRKAFGKPDIKIAMNTIVSSRFADTDAMWIPVVDADHTFYEWKSDKEMANEVIEKFDLFDWSAPTTLMLGRYQPWHEGHQALKEEAHQRTDQVLVGIRNTYDTSEKDPFTFQEVVKFIPNENNELKLRLPNITNIVYGRDVGYLIEKVELSPELQAISATKKRAELGK